MINCFECDDGELSTEDRDTFPKQWVVCSSCDFQVSSFYADEKTLIAFGDEYKRRFWLESKC